jgi:hypothetical protein
MWEALWCLLWWVVVHFGWSCSQMSCLRFLPAALQHGVHDVKNQPTGGIRQASCLRRSFLCTCQITPQTGSLTVQLTTCYASCCCLQHPAGDGGVPAGP